MSHHLNLYHRILVGVLPTFALAWAWVVPVFHVAIGNQQGPMAPHTSRKLGLSSFHCRGSRDISSMLQVNFLHSTGEGSQLLHSCVRQSLDHHLTFPGSCTVPSKLRVSNCTK